MNEYIIPACSGKSIDVKKGQKITVIDIEGGQVVDFFAQSTKSIITPVNLFMYTKINSDGTISVE
ncbi:DUF1989 domain-containing protein [Peptostreptococcus equinus]|uniref:DUF1989 domain-containing protein n=1 Tax=Peptostreptococcus equinus TaxID=3003601 RepID=UPI002F2B7C81